MILNVYKPAGWTSFDVVKKVRGITGEKKVGHGGTLDPFAEGVLILGTGPDTRRLGAITAAVKSYQATLQLGTATDTHDLEGEVISRRPVPDLDPGQVQRTLAGFTGPRKQVPPMYSAKRIQGQRLYKLARRKITVAREPVDIEIYNLDLDAVFPEQIVFSVTCSKGTYIRVLAADLAQALGTAGHLTRLVRTRVGDYSIQDSITIEQVEETWKSFAA